VSLIEPVSSLSIKRAVNLYTIVLFLSFGILLYWLATDRYQTFISSHVDKANNTTNLVAFEINKILKERKRIVDMFIESSIELITDLSDNPEDDVAYQKISERLKKYLPDFSAFNIMTMTNEPVIGDFNGDISELCLQDLGYFIANGKQHIRLHSSGNNAHHYDIASKYLVNGVQKIFFVSFYVNEISDMLSSVQSENHSLILINKGENNLIKVTPEGSRKSDSARLDFRMNGDENFRVLSTTHVKGTDWDVVDMHNEGLFTDYRNRIIREYVIAFYVFTIVVLFMRQILLKQDEKRTLAEIQLQENHKRIGELNDQLDLLSKTDSLTGLYNRRYFDEMMKLEWNRGLRSKNALSCVLFDIDYFKDYNDCYGHQAGDKCLKYISVLMKDCFRRAGDVVARYGGEEFIVIMADSNSEDTISAIEHLQEELAKLKLPHEQSKGNKYVTTSAGFVNQIPTIDESIEDFIRKADEALYLAKAGGRNQWVMHGQQNHDS
jgi:diguanylate cyclase (GGDEF)-like protein